MTKKAEAARRKRFLAKAYKRLTDTKAKLIDESQATLRTEREGNRDDCLDSSDLASEETGRELSTILSARERTKIEQINDALTRISDGNYGLCDSCGFEIAEARLTAVPFTRRCCDCQQEQERTMAGKTVSIGGLFAQERPHLLPLPTVPPQIGLLREVLIARIAPVSRELILCNIAEKALGLPKSY